MDRSTLLLIFGSSVVSSLVTGLLLTLAQPAALVAQTGPTVVTAEQFVLQDRQGRQRAILEVTPDEVVALRMVDRDGTRRLTVSTSETGGAFALFRPDGDPFVSLSAVENGPVGLFVLTDRGGIGFDVTQAQDGGLALIYSMVEVAEGPRGVAPYYRGQIELRASDPPVIRVRDGDRAVVWSSDAGPAQPADE